MEKEIQLLKKYAKSEVVVEKLAKEFQEFKTSKDKFEKELSELKKENDQLKCRVISVVIDIIIEFRALWTYLWRDM